MKDEKNFKYKVGYDLAMNSKNTDSVYELAEMVVKKAEKEAREATGDNNENYHAYLAGVLEAHLKWIPQTRENVKFLQSVLNRN